MRKCESCGKPYSPSKDVFCPHCGAVASSKCTHGSSFDSSRWNRGEIYSAENTGHTTYQQGSEPHAQRTQTQSYTQTQAHTALDTAKDVVRKLDSESVKKLVGAVVAFVVFIGFVTGVFDDLGNDYEYDSSYIQEDYADFYDNGIELDVGKAAVRITPDDEGSYTFGIEIYSVGFEEFYTEPALDISNEMLSEKYFGEILTASLGTADAELTVEEYDDALLYAQCLGTDDTGGYMGDFPFGVTSFEYGELVSVTDFCIYGDNYTIYASLPFDAFSCDENGDVTYYIADISDDGVRFGECQPTRDISYCGIIVSFENGMIYTDDAIDESAVAYTEVVSINADEEG